ncbi:MAG: M16 family metallopeptidase [Vicinamibacterales bacterium]
MAALLILCLLHGVASAQDMGAPLPLDPLVRTGTLSNGLTWYARRNARPAQRVALRLAVKAGSIDEDDDQRGLAHVLEHMAFNGTAHFKPGELIAYLESIGARFGPHVNAYTSYDETVYMLDVPVDREGALERGFAALSDFAGGMTLDPQEIDGERGVVIEEWRGRLGASARMQAVHAKAIYGASKYAERLPIGTPEVLTSFTPARLRDFYDTWYRPDRMAVVVVGDMDPAAAEQYVTKHFGPLKARAPAVERRVYHVPPHEETRFGIATDPEAQQSSVVLVHKRPLRPARTAGDYRRLLLRSLVHQMLNARFSEIARQPAAPFLGASSNDDRLGRDVEATTFGARVPDAAGIATGLEALTREAARLDRFGFGAAELDRGRQWTLASYEQAFNERDKTEHPSLAAELVRHFLDDEPVPGIAFEYELARTVVPAITPDEAAALARTLITEDNRVVLVTAPEQAGASAPTEAVLREAMRRGSTSDVTAWRDDMAGRELMPKKPDTGAVASTREIPEIGVTVLTFANGATVWLKPTDFKNDQVLFTSYAKGGTSLADPNEYYAAALSPTLVGIAGVGGFTPVELDKLLPGRLVDVSPYMSLYTHGVSGSSTPKDLETALQLLYLTFTAPNRTPEGFDLMRRRLLALVANQAQSPIAVFQEKVRQVNTMNHYTARNPTPGDIETLDAAAMWSYYDARFANAADFTFCVVGAFRVADVTPLVARYIGSLPSTGAAAATSGDVRLRFPPDAGREVVRKGREPRSQTVVSFFADTALGELEMHRARAASAVLEIRLRDRLREELGGTYSVSVNYTDTQPVPGYGTIAVRFGSAPERVDQLVAAVFDQVTALRAVGPTDDEVKKVQELERRELETAMRQNPYWLNSLQTVHLLGWDPRTIARRLERSASLSRENIHAAAKKYLPEDRHTVVSLVPSQPATKPEL